MSYGSPSDGQITFHSILGAFRVETSLFHTSRCIMTITDHELKSMMEVLPYYDAVQWALEKGITEGTSADTFSPGVSCTRAQMVTFLWRAAGSPVPKSAANPFKDINDNDYY